MSSLGWPELILIGCPLMLVLAAVIAVTVVLVLRSRRRPVVELKKCPYCAELIQPEAKVCRYCGRELEVPGKPAS